jgi:hypothetical protein
MGFRHMYVNKYITIVATIFFCTFSFATGVFAETHLFELLKQIKNDPIISSGQTGILHVKGLAYLVSVGVAKIEKNTPEAKLKARKIARLIAEKELMLFIEGARIISDEKYSSETVTHGKAGPKLIKEIDSRYINKIRQMGAGSIRSILEVGRWKNETNDYYYCAVSIEII